MGDIKFEPVFAEIPKNAKVRLTDMGHIKEVQYFERNNFQCPIKRLSKDEYVLLVGEDKGEIKEFNHNSDRTYNFNALRQTFKRLRYLINNNFTGGDNELFCTLTYAENMQDTKRLMRDFDVFMKRLRRTYDDFDYLSVIEPQGRGAWHIHLLLRFNSEEKAYIPNEVLRDKWGQGFVNVHRISGVDNVGAYLTAYLADMELSDDISQNELVEALSHSNGIVEKEIDDNGNKVSKKIIKGGRLCFYPTGVNLYRKSRGIKMPERSEVLYSDLKKENGVIGSAKPNYTKGYEMLKSYTDEHFNTLIYECYNLKRT